MEDYSHIDRHRGPPGLVYLAPWVAVDQNRYIVMRPGRPAVPITAREWRVLEVLLRHRGQVVAPEHLIQAGWGGEPRAAQDLYVVISRLRRLIERRPHQPELLVTRRGFGYLLQAARPTRWPVSRF